MVITKSESSDTSETSVTKEITTTTATGTVTTVQEVKTTTTTITSTITSVTHENGSKPSNLSGTVVPRVVVIDGKHDGKSSPESKPDQNHSNSAELEKVTTVKISEALPAKIENSKPGADKKVVVVSSSQEGKPNTTIMNIQSVCPNSKATVLTPVEKLTNDSKGTTVVVLNKEGGQLKFSVAEKGKNMLTKEEDGEEGKIDEKDDTENGHGMLPTKPN